MTDETTTPNPPQPPPAPQPPPDPGTPPDENDPNTGERYEGGDIPPAEEPVE